MILYAELSFLLNILTHFSDFVVGTDVDIHPSQAGCYQAHNFHHQQRGRTERWQTIESAIKE